MATRTNDKLPPDPPRPDTDTGRLTYAIGMSTKSIERLDREIATSRADARGDFATLRSDARTDFRLQFGALIAVALGLAGMMAKGFHWI